MNMFPSKVICCYSYMFKVVVLLKGEPLSHSKVIPVLEHFSQDFTVFFIFVFISKTILRHCVTFDLHPNYRLICMCIF